MGPAISAVLGVGVALFLVALCADVRRRRALERVRSGSRIQDTAKGPVEYAMVGSGPAVLVLHGGMGGWDQAVALGVALLAREGCVDYHDALSRGGEHLRGRYCVIAPSRSGYLRTPLDAGRSPAEGADAIAALLDALGLDRVLVIGVSGGGPTALQFALRHPQRTAALVQVCAISRRHVQPARTTDSFVGRIVFAEAFAWWLDLIYAAGLLYFAWFPRSACRRLLRATETLDRDGIEKRVAAIANSPLQLRWMHGLIESGYPLSVRKRGLNNDLAQFAAIQDYPVEQIRCPTQVIHGRYDGNVPIEHAEFVADRVPGASLFVAETCGHIVWMSDEEPRIREAAQVFLNRHAGSASVC